MQSKEILSLLKSILEFARILAKLIKTPGELDDKIVDLLIKIVVLLETNPQLIDELSKLLEKKK